MAQAARISWSEFSFACLKNGIRRTRYLFTASVGDQSAALFEMSGVKFGIDKYGLQRILRCSTSRFGVGQTENSNCTPLGLHRVAKKIGAGWPAGTVFKARLPIGFTWKGLPEAKITSRILWLEGLETGFNRGGNVDSHARYIYIHGTGDQTSIGKPASCGCIHLADVDLVPLYDLIPSGTLVWIQR